MNLVSTFLLLFALPAHLALIFPIILNVFNLFGIIFTFGLAVPIHVRIDREEKYTVKDLDNLLRYNALRLGCVLVNSIILLSLLSGMLRP